MSFMGGEGEQQGAAAAAMAAGREKSSFAVTCSLLSQYLKEKKGGLQGLAGLDMAPSPAGPGAFRPPTTMNLLSALDAPAEPKDAAKATTAEEKATTTTEPPALVAATDQQNSENPREETGEEARQLTIFYGGKVVVFDNFPAAKVKDLLQMVNGGHGVDKTTSNAAALPKPSHNISDMPIARRNSLHRFLEKRKGRIIAKAPYQVDASVEASKKQPTDEKSWLGFGQDQEVTVKETQYDLGSK